LPESLTRFETHLEHEVKSNRESLRMSEVGPSSVQTFVRCASRHWQSWPQVNLSTCSRSAHFAFSSPEVRIFYPTQGWNRFAYGRMIMGLASSGWGVGGIEAEAGMLASRSYFLTPEVVGVQSVGQAERRVLTATDRAYALTQMLQPRRSWVNSLNSYGEGAASLPLPSRATIGNMAPSMSHNGIFSGVFCSRSLPAMTGRSEEMSIGLKNISELNTFRMPKKETH